MVDTVPMPETDTFIRRKLLSLAVALPALSACMPLTSSRSAGPDRPIGRIDVEGLAAARYLLLGEVHDNAHGHALRFDLLERLTTSSRWAIALEQFDASRQPALAAAQAEASRQHDPGSAARRLAESGGFDFEGWEWDYYRPAIELALERGLPLVAANLSRAEAIARMRGQLAAADDPRPRDWTEAAERSMATEIRDGHCGLLPERAIAPMTDAQIARDRTMARALVDAHRRTGLPVVLLAGNGHVRADIGVPVHLAALDPGSVVTTVWIGEGRAPSREGPASGRAGEASGKPGVRAFDRSYAVQPVERPDPCEALRKLRPPSA